MNNIELWVALILSLFTFWLAATTLAHSITDVADALREPK